MTRDLTALGEVVSMASGKSIKSGLEGPTPVFGSNGIIGGTDEALFDSGVIIGRVGAYCGSTALSRGPFWASDNTIVIRPLDSKRTSLRFLAYAVRHADLNVHAGGAAQPLLTQRDLKPVQIWHPSASTQRKVASVLWAYDDLIGNNRRRIELLEEMAQRIYREWLVEFRYPAHEKGSGGQPKLGAVPDGWQVMSASVAMAIDPKVDLPKDRPVPFVPMAALSESTSQISGVEMRVNPSGSRFSNGDTLFARITPCLENGKTAYVQFLPDGEVAAGSTEFIVLRSRYLTPEFVYLLARSELFRDHAVKSMSGASGRQRVRREAFDGYVLAVPPRELVERFTELVHPLFRASFVLFSENTRLGQARDILLARLFDGQIDVEGLDIDVEEAAA